MVTIKPMDRALANEYLLALVKHYLQGQQAPLEFMLESAWELTRPAKVGGKAYNNEANSEKAFWGTDGSFAYAGERDDIHHRRCINDLDSIPPATIELAGVVFTPWVELMEVHAHDA
jgi:exonuclease V gamma subunit